MKKIVTILAAALLAFAAASAQEQQWLDITALNMEASGQADATHALKQFVLVDDEAFQNHMDVYDRMYAFSQECAQMTTNQAVPEALKEAEASIESLRKTAREHPEMKEMLEEQIKALEEMKNQFAGMENPDVTGYSMDTKQLLKDVISIAVGKKAYTGYRDIGNGLYAVTSAPRYGAIGDDTYARVDVPESSVYSWGAIDHAGKSIIDPKYAEFRSYDEDSDLIILRCKGKDGKERVGACGYDGRIRVPFEYTGLSPFSYGLIASKDGGATCGVITLDGKLVVPAKYIELWYTNDEGFYMLRPDDRLDFYDASFKLLRTENQSDSIFSGEGKG